MAVYKEPKTNTWKVYYRYTDWQGERKQTTKRGFLTKREALAWEREQLNKTKADLDMTFASFVSLLKAVEYHAEIILNVVIKVKYFIETAFYLLEFYS